MWRVWRAKICPAWHLSSVLGRRWRSGERRAPILAVGIRTPADLPQQNAVLRALRLLRDEGLLEFRRGRGITVVGPAHRGAVLARARELVQFARGNGYGRDELIKMIEDIA